MKIILEALRIPPYGGVRTVTIGWIKALAEFSPTTHFIALLSQSEAELQALPNVKQIVIPTFGRFLPRLQLQVLLPWLVHKYGIDIVHFLRNLTVIVPNAQVVVNINDLTRLLLSEGFSKWDILYWQIIQTRVLRYTQHIICISNNTRLDISNWLNYPQDNIITIFPSVDKNRYRPISKDVSDSIRSKYDLPEKFVLYVGGLAKHKNIRTLIKAFARLKQSTHLPHILVIVGGQYHTHNDTQAQTIAQNLLGEQQVIFTGPVPDADLPLLYNAAEVFVFPSLYEGFGLTPLEAMACGTPIIASPVGSLPEVLGEAVCWVEDPLDEQAFAEAMSQVLENDSLQEQMARKGLEQAHKFSWLETARQTMVIYQKLVAKDV